MLNLKELKPIPLGIIQKDETPKAVSGAQILSGKRCEHGSHDRLSKILVASLHNNEKPSEIINKLLKTDSQINGQVSYFLCPSRSEWKTNDRYINCLGFVFQGLQYQWRRGLRPSYDDRSPINVKNVFNISDFESVENFPDPVPLVEGLIYKSELVIMSATAKTGKSWLALDLAYCLVSGTKFLNHFTVVQSKVFVLQTEVGDAQLRKRIIKVFGSDLKKFDSKVFFSNERIKLDSENGIASLKSLIKTYKPELLILDPFYTLHNSSEDSSSEIAPILSDLRALAQEEDVSILLIHHQGKKREGSPQAGHRHRGSSSFADVPDGSISLAPHGLIGNMLTIDFEMRNVEAPKRMDVERDSESMRCFYKGESNVTENFPLDKFMESIAELKDFSATELKNELAKRFSISPRTVSTKLNELLKIGRLKKVKKGKFNYYVKKEGLNGE